jgi:hypothetical protein
VEQWVLVAGAEVTGGADELCTFDRRGGNPVRQGSRDDGQALFGKLPAMPLRPGQAQRPPPQQVEMAGTAVGPDRKLVVQHAARDKPRAQLEVLQQRRETVSHETNRLPIETKRPRSSHRFR